MAEKRYKSFVVIGDDDAKTTRVFFYIGSGEKRSAGAMREDAMKYYEERFPETWFPEISNQRNYNSDPHEFNNIVQAAVAEERAEYTRIPNFGDRWVVTPKVEETPGENSEETTGDDQPTAEHFGKAGTPDHEWYTPPQNAQLTGQTLGAEHEQGEAFMQENYGADSRIEDDRVGLPDDEDDYEEREQVRMSGLEEIEEAYPADMGIAPANLDEITEDIQYDPSLIDVDKLNQVPDDERDTAELPVLQAIGGYNITNDQDADAKRETPKTEKENGVVLPTPEEMEEEARKLRENPDTASKGNTGELTTSPIIPTGPPTNVHPGLRRSCPIS